MSLDDPISSLDDAALDLEAPLQGVARFAQELADAERAVAAARCGPFPTRGGTVSRSVLPPRCPAEVQGRFQILLHLERTFPPDKDQGCIIFVGCQLLEAELDRLLTTPLRPLATTLVDILRQERGEDGPAEVLATWADGRMPATFGTHGLVMLALQSACVRGHTTLLSLLGDRFSPGYLELLRGRAMDRCLNKVRNRFRNPVCHGKATFSRADCEDFARLVIAHRRFLDWEHEGPDPTNPGGDTGALHHLWRSVRQTEEPV